MTIQNRVNEILDQMTAFSKESYTTLTVTVR